MHKFDEMYAQLPFVDSAVRPHYRNYLDWLKRQDPQTMRDRREEAEMIFRRVGITFAVYGDKDEDGAGTERLIPFDLIPRIIPAHEWTSMQKGLVQRVTALNMFIHDIYHDQGILKAGLIPSEQILNNAQYRPEMRWVDVPHKVYSQISGIDIVRAPDAQGNGEYYVLEDNLRVPSGVSYMLEDRKMMMRLFPELFAQHRVAPVAHYPDLLLETLREVAPNGVNVVIDLVGADALDRSDSLTAEGARVGSITDGAGALARGGIYVFVRPSAEDLAVLATLIDEGKLSVDLAETFPFEQAAQAYQILAEGHVRGKIVLTP